MIFAPLIAFVCRLEENTRKGINALEEANKRLQRCIGLND